MTIPSFRRKILSWYQKNKRAMPWRKTSDPYKILVSEVMLQQTGVARVLPKYKEFLREFPTLRALAQSSDRKLLRVWQGLGYWRRVLYLKQTARKIARDYTGKFPKDIQTLETFPGIGPYTARALACFSFGSKEPFLDTNIRRVYLHFFFPDKKKVADAEILAVAKKALVRKNPREWHYALFDYGATVLADKTINRRSKQYHRQSPFEGSFRSFRTRVVRFLLAQPKNKTSRSELEVFLKKELENSPRYSSEEIIASLLRDKILKKSKMCYFL